MNQQIVHMAAQVSTLDQYTQLAVFGSWGFTVNSACINAAMRYVPDEPVDNGIDTYTEYEAARRKLLQDAEISPLPGLLGLQREITQHIDEANGTARGLTDTLEFLTGNAPSKTQFEAEYENRRRLGMKPGIPLKAFVESEHKAALDRYHRLVTRGDDAVRLCETFTLEETSCSDAPEWLPEALEQKMIDKLHARWEKLELVRTNPRRRKADRDSAAADQMLIERVMAEYGEQPGFELDDASEFEAEAGDLTKIAA